MGSNPTKTHTVSDTEKLHQNDKYRFNSLIAQMTTNMFVVMIANKKKISVDHIGRAYKSAIPRGRLKCFAV
jgi:hypothetical protein